MRGVRWAGVGFLALTAVNIVSVTMLIRLATNGRSVLAVFPCSVAAWGCYLVEGELIDRGWSEGSGSAGASLPARLSGHRLHSQPARWVLAVGGVGGRLSTFPTGIVAVGSNDCTPPTNSIAPAISKDVVGRQGVTGKPL